MAGKRMMEELSPESSRSGEHRLRRRSARGDWPACLLRLRGNRAKQGQTYRYSCVCGAAAPGCRRRETLPPVIRQGAFGLLDNSTLATVIWTALDYSHRVP
jgi:hypothetical protein